MKGKKDSEESLEAPGLRNQFLGIWIPGFKVDCNTRKPQVGY